MQSTERPPGSEVPGRDCQRQEFHRRTVECDLGASHAENHNALDVSFTRIVAFVFLHWIAASSAANTWSRAKGAVHALHDTAVALRRRIDDVDPHGYAHRIACELEASVCDLKEAIACDAPRQRIEYGMQEIGMLNQQLIRAVASHCDLRNSRRVLAELDRFQDRYCTLERELRKCISRIPVCPPSHPNFLFHIHPSDALRYRVILQAMDTRLFIQPFENRSNERMHVDTASRIMTETTMNSSKLQTRTTIDRSNLDRISTPRHAPGNSIKREVLDLILTQAIR